MRKVEEYNTAATRSFHSDINFFFNPFTCLMIKEWFKKLAFPFLATIDLSDQKLSFSKVSKYLWFLKAQKTETNVTINKFKMKHESQPWF